MVCDDGFRNENIVQSGDFSTDETKDYTVKIDVQNLQSNTYYYYQFEALGEKSIIGRTKTAPKTSDSQRLRFAVISCNNFQNGYFNAFRMIANRHDLDAVIHLGDYIYEYKEGGYGDKSTKRNISPTMEIIDLQDYRMRYSQYRLDVDFIKIHQHHPFICIWDDHETANDAYKDGASNHQPQSEGDWESRKAAAKQAYFEWLPIRNHPQQKINRVLNYGNLVDLIMLDTRLEARHRKPNDMYAASYMDSTRVMLGEKQREWLFDALDNSEAKWKIIGQQVIFSELNVGWANPLDRLKTENYLLDIWDGYPVERMKIINHFEKEKLENVVFLTGDFHSSFGFEVTPTSTDSATYNPKTGRGAVAVEFVTPSITSSNFDEAMSNYRSRKFEECLNKPCGGFPFFWNKNPNPHIKYVDLDRNGYIILDVTAEQVQANFYYMKTILKPSDKEYFGTALATQSGKYHLEIKPENTSKSAVEASKINIENYGTPQIISKVYQKENNIFIQIHSSKPNKSGDFCLQLKNENGEIIRTFSCQFQDRTVYTTYFSVSELPKGKYTLSLDLKENKTSGDYFLK
ncbi:MAG: phosphodiesterase [Saprospiraceae bacterium]|nr:phosphodiesterase [Saprospiraceae bacterium]